MAANEYLQETGKDELDARWIAEFFQDGGVQDDYPRQDLVAFSDLVQKALSKKSERADKQSRFQLDKIVRYAGKLRKPQEPAPSIKVYDFVTADRGPGQAPGCVSRTCNRPDAPAIGPAGSPGPRRRH